MEKLAAQNYSSQIALEPEKTGPPRLRLEFLDGLRGLAVLYVVLYHALMAFRISHPDQTHLPTLLRHSLTFAQFTVLNYGRYAVDIFIVLSGYCLMLPVVRAGGVLAGGFRGFFTRRARRILPPYYAALAVCLLIIAFVPGMNVTSTKSFWKAAVPAFTPEVLLSHLFLVHNLTPWGLRIDSPMWSVATEWQIYFFFPLLLLPLWRRWGIWASVAAAFGVGLFPHYICHGLFDGAGPWLLGLFALGMMGTVFSFAAPGRFVSRRVPWRQVGYTAAATVIVLTVMQRASWANITWIKEVGAITWGQGWTLDLLVGVAATALIVSCTQHVLRVGEPLTLSLRLLTLPPVLRVGAYSYSLYLMHGPVLGLVDLVSLDLRLSDALSCVLMFGVAVPLALGTAYLFHKAFEEPFLTGTHLRGSRMNTSHQDSPS